MKSRKSVMVICFLFFFSVVSYAGIPVFDYTNLFQNIIKVFQGVKEYAVQIKSTVNTALIVLNQYRQLENDAKTLGTLGGSSYDRIIGTLRENIKELDEIMTEVEGIKYEYDQIEKEYYALFPNGINNYDWKKYDFAKFEGQIKRWNDTVMESSAVAMKAQAGLSRLKDQNQYVESLLNESKNSGGQVRQLQVTNQLIGSMSDRLGEIHKTSATAARLNSLLASVEAQREAALREKERRLRLDYTKKGDYKTSVVKTLPEMKH